jgi:hypothetical protein
MVLNEVDAANHASCAGRSFPPGHLNDLGSAQFLDHAS